MAWYNKVVSWFRARFGAKPSPPPILPPVVERIPPVVRIYTYVVRVSGYVLPPMESLRKKKGRQGLDKETVIQFELSFEDRPFFRTVIAKQTDAEMKYKNELAQLVKDQEDTSLRKKAFSYPIPKSNKFEMWEDYIAGTSLTKSKIRKERPDEFTLGKPSFMVDAIGFEPTGYFDVPSNQLREFKASDDFIFKIYRPEQYPEQAMNEWDGSFEHSLS